eukprot:1181312-Prorocentrum_minimum.AAC.2
MMYESVYYRKEGRPRLESRGRCSNGTNYDLLGDQSDEERGADQSDEGRGYIPTGRRARKCSRNAAGVPYTSDLDHARGAGEGVRGRSP